MSLNQSVVIPMMGTGQRFLDAGYSTHKSLLQIRGKPVLEHILGNYSWAKSVHFLTTDQTAAQVKELVPQFAKYGPEIEIHVGRAHKLGPVWSLLQFEDAVEKEDSVWVNYSDFGWAWSPDNEAPTVPKGTEVLVPFYRGFHPHNNGTTNYAYMELAEQRIVAIQEKTPFTEDKRNEPASSGTYYFKTWQFAMDLARKVVNSEFTVGGEYFVSQMIDQAVTSGNRCEALEIPFFFQWGTPEDLELFLSITNSLDKFTPSHSKAAPKVSLPTVFLAAGEARRFQKEGLPCDKYNLPFAGTNILSLAMETLSDGQIFVAHGDLCTVAPRVNQEARIYSIEKSSGQLHSAIASAKLLVEEGELNLSSWVCFAPSDTLLSLREPLDGLIEVGADAIVLTREPNLLDWRNAEQFGWVFEHGASLDFSIKRRPNKSSKPKVLTGAFLLRIEDLLTVGNKLLRGQDQDREVLLDHLMEEMSDMGRSIHCASSEALSLGTPEEYNTAIYFEQALALKEQLEARGEN
jgi:CTP:molybdopterin cytidylyltransferase MocA